MVKELTDIQRKILYFITEHKQSAGYPPTLADIAAKFGYTNRATVQQHLKAIEKKGYIKRNPKLSRGIEVLAENNYFIKHDILGEVAAGSPLTVYDNVIDSIDLPSIVKMPPNSFLLRVKGDSLKDAYIFNSDIIIVNPNLLPKDGDFTVALLEGEAVVKRFYKMENKIELRSENKEYKTIVIDKTHPNFTTIGVVVGIYRTVDKRNG